MEEYYERPFPVRCLHAGCEQIDYDTQHNLNGKGWSLSSKGTYCDSHSKRQPATANVWERRRARWAEYNRQQKQENK